MEVRKEIYRIPKSSPQILKLTSDKYKTVDFKATYFTKFKSII